MKNEIKVKLDNIERLQEEIKEMIVKTSTENKKVNDELLNLIKRLGR